MILREAVQWFPCIHEQHTTGDTGRSHDDFTRREFNKIHKAIQVFILIN